MPSDVWAASVRQVEPQTFASSSSARASDRLSAPAPRARGDVDVVVADRDVGHHFQVRRAVEQRVVDLHAQQRDDPAGVAAERLFEADVGAGQDRGIDLLAEAEGAPDPDAHGPQW